jgi:hypothetical protein
MRLAKDLHEFVELLISNQVDFLIVGAHALAFHGHARYTGDLDVWVRPTLENGGRLMTVLRDLGFSSLDVTADDFARLGKVVQLGHPPVRIDLLTAITGVDFDSAWDRRLKGSLDNLNVFFLDRASLITNKRAAGRPQDIADATMLEQDEAER